MQIYILYILLLNEMVKVVFCDTTTEDNRNPTPIEEKEINSENRRKLPIFPRNNIKFVVTPKPYRKEMFTYPHKENILKKIPFVTPTVRSSVAMTQTSRKPVMKLRTFTIQPYGNGRYKNMGKFTQNQELLLNKTDSRSLRIVPVTQYKEDHTTEVYGFEESQSIVKKSPIFENSEVFDNKLNKPNRHQPSVVIKSREDEVSSEEEKDRNEFIFLEKKDTPVFRDLLDNYNQDLHRDVETTTEVNAVMNSRVKRSQNIIEEENMGTTISGLKYTGRDTRLVNNDMYFKNINS